MAALQFRQARQICAQRSVGDRDALLDRQHRSRSGRSTRQPNNQFPLQARRRSGSFKRVRIFLASCLLFAFASSASAEDQDQDQKLIDRLLKPNTTLQNNAQNKTFTSAGVPVNKRASVGAFYVREKSSPKTFAGTRDFSTRTFDSRSFHRANDNAKLSSQQLTPKVEPSYATPNANLNRTANDSSKASATHAFSGNRPFLDKGKSQKSLNRQNPPMTIEQVRELLNKNK